MLGLGGGDDLDDLTRRKDVDGQDGVCYAHVSGSEYRVLTV